MFNRFSAGSVRPTGGAGGTSPRRSRAALRTVWTALAATVGVAALVISDTPPAGASHLPFPVYAPWTSGQVRVVGGPGSYYGEGKHIHRAAGGHGDGDGDYWAVDINGLDGGDTDCGYYVRATWSGTVTTSVNSGDGYGQTIIVSHGNGVTSRYAHLQERWVSSGPVSRGQVLGRVGKTGGTFPCHLHFEIQKDNKSTPPSAMSNTSLPDTVTGDSTGYRVTSNNAQ